MRWSVFKDLAKCLLLASTALALGCSDQKDPGAKAAAHIGEPNFHTNTLLVATDWGPKTFDPLLKQFEREQKVRVRLLTLDELSEFNPTERPVVDLYLLGGLQSLRRLKTDDLQFVQTKASISLQPFAANADQPWVMLGYWPLLSTSRMALSGDLSELTQRRSEPVCASESQLGVITQMLKGSGYLSDPEASALDTLAQTTPRGAVVSSDATSSEGSEVSSELDAQNSSDLPVTALTATRLNVAQAVSSNQCSSMLFLNNNQLVLSADEREVATLISPVLVDGPVATVPKDATNPLKALWMIEWLLSTDAQQQLTDKYQTHTVLIAAIQSAKTEQLTDRLPSAESVQWASTSDTAAP